MKKLTLIVLLALVSCNKTKKNSQKMNTNPLLSTWETPFGTPPFDKIKSSDYLPALREAIQMHNAEVQAILTNTKKPTFKNTIEALELTGKDFYRVSKVFFAVAAANTDSIIKATEKEIVPEMTAHNDEIILNEALFERIKMVYDARKTLALDKDALYLLEKTYEEYIKAGVNLQGENKKRLKAINKELAALKIQFGANLLDETNAFELHVTSKKDLGNLSESSVALAAKEAKKRGHKSGWSFTLQRPSINPFLETSPNRDFREKLFQGYAHRGNNDNKQDNKVVLNKIVTLRVEKANLLGFKTWADYVLGENMAKNAKNVYSLLDKLWTPALAMAKKDHNALAKMMHNEGIKGTFRGSDWRYYVAKVRAKRYNFDDTATKPYFEFNNVRDGAFSLAKKLFGLTFKERNDIAKWHKDQQVFEVLEADGKHVGIIYMDFFARESKRGGAWMNALRSQSNVTTFVTPIVTNNFNFPAPTAGKPSLLTFREAQTVFHEFGHALHGLLSHVKYERFSGTNVPRDFVEFPSQVMENWMSEPVFLATYAKHYQTGEVIPTGLITKMNQANSFDEGFRTVEYMAAAYLDMNWHTLDNTNPQNVNTFEKQVMDKIGLVTEILPRYRSTYYAHIFSGGYSSAYYAYMWSEVLDADTFATFKASGDVFNPELAKKYRAMLAAGGSKKGEELYKDFLGRAPQIEPLLIKKGFLEK
jgi:peptidyl-dipeptidase Dcp